MKKRTIDPQEKMERVLAASRKLIVERGFHNVSIPDIVKASGVSTGAIYHHFSNKESLARYIQDQTLSDFNEMLMARLSGTSTTYQKLRAFAYLVLDIAENDPILMHYMLFLKHGEFLSNHRPICYSEPFLWVQQTIAQGMESGELRQGDRLLAAAAFTGVVLRAIELRLTGVLERSLQEGAEELIGIAWRAIKAD